MDLWLQKRTVKAKYDIEKEHNFKMEDKFRLVSILVRSLFKDRPYGKLAVRDKGTMLSHAQSRNRQTQRATRYLQGAPGRRGVACHRGRSNTCRAASSPPVVGSRVSRGRTASRRSALRPRSLRGITAPTWSLPSLSPVPSSRRHRNSAPPATPPPFLPLASPALPVPAPT